MEDEHTSCEQSEQQAKRSELLVTTNVVLLARFARTSLAQLMWCCWLASLASLLEDEHTRDGSREMATDIMATSTTKLTIIHSIRIRLARSACFARPSLKMRTISLRSAQNPGTSSSTTPRSSSPEPPPSRSSSSSRTASARGTSLP